MTEIPFARPELGEEEIEAVTHVLRSGWLTTGSQAAAFEREFARALGVPHALAVNSATAGLHLGLEAVGVGEGDTVIVPSMTFTATAEVVRYLGATVAFADTKRESLLIDPDSIRRTADEVTASGGRVAAIIVVHITGSACAMREINAIAEEFAAVVIEDAAHSFPGWSDEGYMGCLSQIGVFSFYANKTITTGEGGMVVTANPDYARRIEIMRSHGIDRQTWDRYTVDALRNARATPDRKSHWYYQVVEPGFKYNLSDIAAAIGRVQLTKASSFLAARRRVAQRYLRELHRWEEEGILRLPRAHEGDSWHLFVIEWLVSPTYLSRDELIERLRERGIGCSVHYIPLHHMPYWRAHARYTSLPRTDEHFSRIVSIPIFPGLTDREQGYIIETLNTVCNECLAHTEVIGG